MSSGKPVHLKRSDWASDERLWKGVLEGKDIGTGVTVLFYATEETGKGPKGSKMVKINIPWYGIDDNFYYAQGVAYALYESFKAIRIDFISVLKDKNSVRLVDKILEDLYRCHFEPLIVFNGDPGSIFANHSLNLSGVFNDARQKVYSLTVALMRG